MGKENKIMRVHLTPDQLEGVRKQANDLGWCFEQRYPGTHYDRETMMWDYSQNENAIKIFGNNPPYKIPMSFFAEISGVNI